MWETGEKEGRRKEGRKGKRKKGGIKVGRFRRGEGVGVGVAGGASARVAVPRVIRGRLMWFEPPAVILSMP